VCRQLNFTYLHGVVDSRFQRLYHAPRHAHLTSLKKGAAHIGGLGADGTGGFSFRGDLCLSIGSLILA
jgi:hypothetical protein